MNEEMREMLETCFTEVMEKMAFMFVEEADPDEIPDSSDENLKAKMNFVGNYSGSLMIIVQRDILMQIAPNVLGDDPDGGWMERIGIDALSELLNVTCGSILTSLFGHQPVFDLTVPEVTLIDDDEWRSFRNDPETLKFLLDDKPVMLRFNINK